LSTFSPLVLYISFDISVVSRIRKQENKNKTMKKFYLNLLNIYLLEKTN